MTTIKSRLLKGSIIAGLALAPVAAMAQTADPADPTAPETAPQTAPEMAADFSDEQLENFVEATMKAQEVRSGYMAEFETAETEEARQDIARKANEEMAQVIETSEGMDIETYNKIGAAAQADPELNQRLITLAQAYSAEGAAPSDEG